MTSSTNPAAHAPPPDGWIGTWAPTVGDPTVGGWLLALTYLGAAFLSWRAAAHVPEGRRMERWWWPGLSGLLLLLGVNKQLDLQTALTEMGRVITQALGLVELRSLMRWGFVLALGLAVLVCSWILVRLARRASRPTRTSIWGSVALMGFVVLRAAMSYRVGMRGDDSNLGSVSFFLLEFLPLLTICIGATGRTRTPTKPVVAHQK